MKHNSYKMSCESITTVMRRGGVIDIPKKDRGEKAILKAMTRIYDLHEEMYSTMDFIVHCEEWGWLTSERQTYFFDDTELAQSIMRGSYSIKDAEALWLQNESFMLMLPADLELGGKPNGGGLLVTVFEYEKRGTYFVDKFLDAMNEPRREVEITGDMGRFTVCIDYQQGNSQEYCRLAMPSHAIEAVMAMQSYEGYKDFQDENNMFNYFQGLNLDAAEHHYQFDMLRLVCGFLVYRKAMPDRIREGLPHAKPKDALTPYVHKVKTSHLGHPVKASSSKTGHYRSWFFRQLMHPKFYKGEHAGKAIGSRIIFVQDSFIGDAEVATAEG